MYIYIYIFNIIDKYKLLYILLYIQIVNKSNILQDIQNKNIIVKQFPCIYN